MSDKPRRTPRTPPTRARAREETGFPEFSEAVEKAPRVSRREKWPPLFLEALAELGVVSYACKAARVSRSTVYERREKDAVFRAAWDEAAEIAADMLEQEAHRRAVEGTARPVYQGGKLVGAERQYSDTLLMFLLKARRPEKFRERVDLKHSGQLGLTVTRLHELAAGADES